jgi:transposase
MKTSIAWSPGAGLNVIGVERRERAWRVTVDSRQPTFCPECGAQSKSRHSTYWRTLRDLSAQGAPVIVHARLGRWRCRNQLRDRRTFTERVPGPAAPFARRTARLAGIVRLLGHSAGGRPSERLMRRLGMPVSDTTILASLKEHAMAAVHVAGVDDWAWRKGSNYGTIIVDLEHRVVVDVLADRSAATTASWFKDHPDVEVISRDRAGLYAKATREGAPQARQVADRFHLLQNFRETIERQLGGYEAQSDCASDAVTQTRLMRRGRRAVRQQLFDEIRDFLKGAVPSARSPTRSVLVADGSKGGSVASICRTATQ